MTTPAAPVSSSAPSTSSSPSTAPSSQPAQAKSSDSTSSAPKSSAPSQSKSDGLPSVESVTGGAVKSEKSEAASSDDNRPGETAEQKAERKAEERRIKAKVNGREREYTEEEAARKIALVEGAEEKYQEAAKMRKQVEQFIETLRNDPKKILLNPDLGFNARQFAEELLGEEVRREMMDPVQRELEDLRKWKQEQEDARKQAEETQRTTVEQQRYEQAKMQKLKEYDTKIAAVLNKAQLPKTPYTVKRVAEVLHKAKVKGYELDMETAVDFVREGYMTDLQSLTGGLEGEQLLNLLGPEIAKRIRKHDLDKIKAKVQPQMAAQPEAQPNDSAPRSSAKKDGFMTTAEWIENARKKAGL